MRDDKVIVLEEGKTGAVLIAHTSIVRVEQESTFSHRTDAVNLTRDQLVTLIKFIDDNEEKS